GTGYRHRQGITRRWASVWQEPGGRFGTRLRRRPVGVVVDGHLSVVSSLSGHVIVRKVCTYTAVKSRVYFWFQPHFLFGCGGAELNLLSSSRNRRGGRKNTKKLKNLLPRIQEIKSAYSVIVGASQNCFDSMSDSRGRTVPDAGTRPFPSPFSFFMIKAPLWQFFLFFFGLTFWILGVLNLLVRERAGEDGLLVWDSQSSVESSRRSCIPEVHIYLSAGRVHEDAANKTALVPWVLEKGDHRLCQRFRRADKTPASSHRRRLGFGSEGIPDASLWRRSGLSAHPTDEAKEKRKECC
ncbi:hypothetical protein L249_0297, partial [Ophiocordyceps polyrhachis-furcata BCC 54312]